MSDFGLSELSNLSHFVEQKIGNSQRNNFYFRNPNCIYLSHFRKTISSDNRTAYQFKHLSKFEYHSFLKTIVENQNQVNFLAFEIQLCCILFQLKKIYNQCIFMCSKEMEKLKKGDNDSSPNESKFTDLNSNLSFIRNVCEKIKFILQQPWIIKAKFVLEDVLNLPNKTIIIFSQFLNNFTNFLTKIIDVSYFLILLGLENISLDKTCDYSDDTYFNLVRGLEEFNYIFRHMKSLKINFINKLHLKSSDSIVSTFSNNFDYFICRNELTVRNIVKTISNFRSFKMAERIYQFFFSNKDILQAFRHRYLNIVFDDSGESISYRNNQIEATSETPRTSRNILSERKYKRYIHRLSNRMKHTKFNEEVTLEYQFILTFIEHLCKLTDLMQKIQKSEHRKYDKLNEKESSNEVSKKSVQWRDCHNTSVQSRLLKYYKDRYWYQVDLYLDDIESMPDYRKASHQLPVDESTEISRKKHIDVISTIGFKLMHNFHLKIALNYLITNYMSNTSFPDELKPCLYNQSFKLKMSAIISQCHEELIQALGFSHDDRFFPDQNVSNVAKRFLKIIGMLNSSVDQIQTNENIGFYSAHIRDVFHMSCVTANSILIRTRLRCQKIISSWNIPMFIFLVFSDTEYIADQLQQLFDKCDWLIRDISLEHCTFFILEFQMFQKILSVFQTSVQEMKKYLEKRIYDSILLCIYDEFPEEKVWLTLQSNTGDSSLEIVNNEYITTIISLVINPIVSSLKYLDENQEKLMIVSIIELMFETLINFIMEKQVKMSLLGAKQLETDVDYVFHWLKQFVKRDIYNYVRNQPIINKLYQIIHLLKTQHDFVNSKSKRKSLGFCSNRRAVMITEATTNLLPTNKTLTIRNNNNGDNNNNNDNNNTFIDFHSTINTSADNSTTSSFDITNQKQWLKLRAYPLETNVIRFNGCK